MVKTLEAHDKLIRKIFEGSCQLEIPDYQRPYAWTTEQATELFDDMYSAMQDASLSGASNHDFTRKKDIYFKDNASLFVLTQEVQSGGTWTPALLDDRQKRLVKVLSVHWSLGVATDSNTSGAATTATAGGLAS